MDYDSKDIKDLEDKADLCFEQAKTIIYLIKENQNLKLELEIYKAVCESKEYGGD